MHEAMIDLNLQIHSVTPQRWAESEALFGVRGAGSGCWRMFWPENRADFQRLNGLTNRQLMQALVKSDAQPGQLANKKGQPVGWGAPVTDATD